MSACSPELELLARLARLHPSADDDARARTLAALPLDWDRVVRLAEYHGVAPLVDRNIARLTLDAIPADVREAIRDARLSSTSADLARHDRWLALNARFAAEAIPVLTLKGFSVVHALYGELGLRPVGDLDLLVAREDVARAIALLERSGYLLTSTWARAIRHVGLDYVLTHAIEVMLVSASGVVVDLHWEPTHGVTPPGAELLAHAAPLRLDEQEVMVAAPEHAVVVLLLHGHAAQWSRLRWVVDVIEWAATVTPEAFQRVVAQLDALGMRAALVDVLALIAAMWGEPLQVAQGEVTSLGFDAADRPRLRQRLRMLEWTADPSRVQDAWRPFRLLRQRIDTHADLFSALVGAARPTHNDWAEFAVPDGLRGVYRLLRPLRVFRDAWRAVVARALEEARRIASVGRRVAAHRPSRASARHAVHATAPSAAAATAVAAPPDPEHGPHVWRDDEKVAMTFVTAIYDSGPDSLLGGRGWGLRHYLPTLINIANLGAPIVVYCPASEVQTITDAIAPHFHDFRVIPFPLSQFEFYEEFIAWKRSYLHDAGINNRNEVLCFLKSYWVQEAIAANPFGHDTYYWIDAGLAHHGIFPLRIGGVEWAITHPPRAYYPHNPANIFTPSLGRSIAQWAPRGQVAFCVMPFLDGRFQEEYQEQTATFFDRPPGSVAITEHLVGGLWGGHQDDLRALHVRYRALLHHFITTRTRTLEEQIFSSLFAVHPELFAPRRFSTWYFHSPGEPNSFLDADGDSFYKLFLRDPVRVRSTIAPADRGRPRCTVYLPGTHAVEWFPSFARRFAEEYLTTVREVEVARPVGQDPHFAYPIYEIGAARVSMHGWIAAFESPTTGRIRIATTIDHPLELFTMWGFDPARVDRVLTGQFTPSRLAAQIDHYLDTSGYTGSPEAFRAIWHRYLYSPYGWELVDRIAATPAPQRNDRLFFLGQRWEQRDTIARLARMAGPHDRTDIRLLEDWNDRLPPDAYFALLRQQRMALSFAGAGDLCNRDIECFALGIPVLRPVFTGELVHPLEPGVHYVGVPFEPVGPNRRNRPVDSPKDPEQLAADLLATWRRVRDDVELLDGIAANARAYYEHHLAYPAAARLTLELLDLDGF